MKESLPSKKKSNLKGAKLVNAYLASLPNDARTSLLKLRKMIAERVPEAEQGFSYGIPAFRLDGRPMVWFAAFKEHCSFFPGAGAIRQHAADLKSYKTSKGTIQFSPNKPPPARLVAKLIKARLAEMQAKKR